MSGRAATLVSGFVTQCRYLEGCSLHEIERRLGFRAGRLAQGASFATLDRLPTLQEFETAGYSQVAAHRHHAPADLDPVGLRKMAMSVWSPTGPNQLIKVLPKLGHDSSMADDEQYPPGTGVPQWKLTQRLPGTIVALLVRYSEVFRLG